MVKLLKYYNDFNFYEHFTTANFKFKKRFFYAIKKFYNPLQLILLFIPIRYIPSKYKNKSILIKYSTDVAILKENMPEVFKNGNISICNYKFTTILNTEPSITAKREFELMGGIYEIFIKDPYDIKKYVPKIKEPVIIDCGANIGLFSLFASFLFKDAKIYSFEPTNETFNLMKDILSENKINNVFIFNVALGSEIKNSTLLTSIEGLGTGNTLLETGRIPPGNVINQEVKIITIDYFVFQQEKLNKVDYIKIDTEGFEKEILKGAKETIKKFKPIIACAAYYFSDDKEKIIEIVLKIRNDYQYYLNSDKSSQILIFY